jgi:hypothetical protein
MPSISSTQRLTSAYAQTVKVSRARSRASGSSWFLPPQHHFPLNGAYAVFRAPSRADGLGRNGFRGLPRRPAVPLHPAAPLQPRQCRTGLPPVTKRRIDHTMTKGYNAWVAYQTPEVWP